MSNKKIKVLHIIPTFSTGGAEKMVLQYGRLVNKKKFDFFVACGVEDGELRLEFEKNKDIHVFVSSRKKHGGRLGAWRVLKKYIWEIRPDIIHTHLISSDVIGYWVKKHANWPVKWVSTMHNVEYRTPWWRRQIWRFILPCADTVIAVGKKVEQATIELFKIKPSGLITIPNGIVLDSWLKVKTAEQIKGKVRIATIGRLMKQKGHRYLIAALAEIKDFDWQWEVFGAGELEQKLKKQADKLGIGQRIIWRGVIANLPEKLNKIDLVVQPSLWEGLSLVVMEAMSAGKCVVASNVAGSELIDDQHNGFIAPTGDSNALAKMIRKLIANPDLIIQTGKQAREKAKEEFGIESGMKKLEILYGRV